MQLLDRDALKVPPQPPPRPLFSPLSASPGRISPARTQTMPGADGSICSVCQREWDVRDFQVPGS